MLYVTRFSYNSKANILKFILFSILSTDLSASPLISQVSPQIKPLECEQLFITQPNPQHLQDKLSEKSPYQDIFNASLRSTETLFKIFKKTTSNPTNRRQETKNVIQQKDYKNILNTLILQLATEGITLGLRDAETQGYQNVTQTQYSRQIRFKPQFVERSGFATTKEIRGVFRQRKYGLVDNQKSISIPNFIVSPTTKDYSFFEFKFDDPEYQDSVLKPRVYMADTVFKKLTQESVSVKELNHIIDDIASLKPNQSLLREDVAHFIQFILDIRSSQFNFDPVFVSFYNRTSRFARFMNAEDKQVFEVQITEDQFISAFRKNKQNKFEQVTAYNDNTLVIETKVPVNQSSLRLENTRLDYQSQSYLTRALRLVPGYRFFLEFQSSLLKHHLYEDDVMTQKVYYKPNSGKKGLLEKVSVIPKN